MKKLHAIFVLLLIFTACSGDESKSSGGGVGNCKDNSDCPSGQLCDVSTGLCHDPGGGLYTDSEQTDADADGGQGEIPDGMECRPGSTKKCPYEDDPTTEGVGPCRAPVMTCLPTGEWGICKGGVYPEEDVCDDNVDNDCDGKVDNGSDRDGDGFGVCEGDCCDLKADCPHPEKVYPGAEEVPNGMDDNCNDQVDEGVYDCDPSTSPPFDGFDLAKSLGLCHKAEDGDVWGVVSAEIVLPSGSVGVDPRAYGVLSSFGSVSPEQGSAMLALSSGEVASPVPAEDINQNTGCRAPSDWLSKNNNEIPDAPACEGSPKPRPTIFDAVMLKLKIKVPPLVRSFSFDAFFFSKEFNGYVCGYYNDFFVALLDSKYTSDDPDKQNPADKNLAVDAAGNPLGVNLAKSGLFAVCAPQDAYPSCTGDTLLAGTGYEGHGATGWLKVRGNVVPEETITLRLALWDSGDHRLDSLVLLDNFTWYPEEYKPGTSN